MPRTASMPRPPTRWQSPRNQSVPMSTRHLRQRLPCLCRWSRNRWNPRELPRFRCPFSLPTPRHRTRASGRHRSVPVPAVERASAHQRPVPERQARVGATPPVAHSLAATSVGARVAETLKAPRPDRWQVMNEDLGRCGGDLIARIVCHQRVRGHFCEGYWGEVPECASVVAYNHRP